MDIKNNKSLRYFLFILLAMLLVSFGLYKLKMKPKEVVPVEIQDIVAPMPDTAPTVKK